MAQVTSPIILDSTGQQIHSDLQQIKNVLTTPSAAEDITFDNTGTGMQADDVQDAITELKSNLTELGTPITANWIAGNYSADASNVTGSMTLTEGTYLITYTIPPISAQKLFYFYDGSIVETSYLTATTSYFSKTFLYTCNSTKTCNIKLGQSGALTISNADRGQFFAVKLS